jgi:hypothetical protein
VAQIDVCCVGAQADALLFRPSRPIQVSTGKRTPRLKPLEPAPQNSVSAGPQNPARFDIRVAIRRRPQPLGKRLKWLTVALSAIPASILVPVGNRV